MKLQKKAAKRRIGQISPKLVRMEKKYQENGQSSKERMAKL